MRPRRHIITPDGQLDFAEHGKKRKRRPQNGAYYKALTVGDRHLVGGYRKFFAERGIKIAYEWYGRGVPLQLRKVPPDIDLMFIFRDSTISRNSRQDLEWQVRQNRPDIFVIDVREPRQVRELLAKANFEALAVSTADTAQRDDETLHGSPPPPPPPILLVPEPPPPTASLPTPPAAAVPPPPPPTPAQSPQPPPPPIPLRPMSPRDNYKEQRKRLAVTLFQLREKKGGDHGPEPAKRVAAFLGVSTGLIYLHEKETGPAPTDEKCALYEKYHGLARGTLPRLAQRVKHGVTPLPQALPAPSPALRVQPPAPSPRTELAPHQQLVPPPPAPPPAPPAPPPVPPTPRPAQPAPTPAPPAPTPAPPPAPPPPPPPPAARQFQEIAGAPPVAQTQGRPASPYQAFILRLMSLREQFAAHGIEAVEMSLTSFTVHDKTPRTP